MLKDVLKYIKNHKKIYLIITIVLIIDYSLIPVPTRLLANVSDLINSGEFNLEIALKMVVILILMAIFIYILEVFWTYYLFRQAELQKKQTSLNLFKKIITSRAIFFEKYSSADILMHLTNDKDVYGDMFGYGAMSVLIAISISIFVIPSMFMISIKISLLAIIPIFILGVIVYFLGNTVENQAEELRKDVEELNNEILETVEGIRVTRVYNSFENDFKNFKVKNLNLTKKIIKISILDLSFQKIASLLTGVSIVLIVFFGAYSVESKIISVGEIIALQILASLLIEPMWILSSFVYVYLSAKISHKKLTDFLIQDDGIKNNDELPIDNFKSLVFENYNFKYPKSEFQNLKNINLILNKGETLGIVGKMGSGKTTLIRQLLQQYPKGEGILNINNQDIASYNFDSVNRLFSYVPQEHVLFSDTILENIAFGKQGSNLTQIKKAIELADFTKDLDYLSAGINTFIGEKGVSISGGQKQRISIARALLKDSEILIFDDSLSAVDVKTERKIIENLKTVRKDKTNIIITHRFSSLVFADKIIVFDDGEIIESGTFQQLINNKSWFYNQYNIQKMESDNENNN